MSDMASDTARAPIVLFLLLVFHSFASAEIEPVTREVYLMGTILKATLFERDREKGVQDLEKLIRSIEETEEQLSTWRATSELSRLNVQDVSQPFSASPSLCVLMTRLSEWVKTTQGAFDPTVGHLLNLWGIHGTPQIPQTSAITEALSQTGFTNLQMTGCMIEKTKPVVLDAGAFGKGEALDRALAIAQKNDYAPLLLDFGGQIAAWKIPPSSNAWQLSIADPSSRIESSLIRLSLRSGSLSTSSGSVRDHIVNGRRVSHILDPRTGYPVESFGSVTVWDSQALAADIFSTALYVMGPSEGYPWALQHQVAACFLIQDGKDTRVKKTPQFDVLVDR
jgi:thiamine biosynthesis lipoprotein